MENRTKLPSPVRVVAGTAVGLGLLLVLVGALVRQPVWGCPERLTSIRCDPDLLRDHVEFLSGPCRGRNPRHPEVLERAARYVEERLTASGGRVTSQWYEAGGVRCRNIIARFGPADGPLLVVGAHYDVYGDLPGADDNASGTAALLELSRLLGRTAPVRPVELVAYSTEEPPYFGGPEMGSAVHARSLAAGGGRVQAMICLEMVGYFTRRQPRVSWLTTVLYPGRGDFVVLVSRWRERRLVRMLKRAMSAGRGVEVCSYSGPPVPGTDLSDHRNYWAAGFPAVMITDTAFLRNPNYHTADDTAGTLDYRRMAGVVDGVLNAILALPAEPAADPG